MIDSEKTMEINELALALDETKTKIQELQDGLMEIATTVGTLRGYMKTNKETPDAHNPGTIQKIIKEQAN